MLNHLRSAFDDGERIVVLGARGFLGTAVCKRLAAKNVTVIPLGSSDLDLTQTDAADKLAALLRPGDALVMLSALTPDKGRDAATLIKNILMMQNVCAALTDARCAHFVYVSSDAVYGSKTGLITEHTPPSPEDLYGAMHLSRELMARSLSRIPVLILRPTAIYGLDDTHNGYGPNRFRRSAAAEGRILLFGGGEEMRDHVYVEDVAALMARCLERRSAGTLNIATGNSRSFSDVATLVSRPFGVSVSITSLPRAAAIT
ncbi:MAG TPA: NAD(P)-dependent oxidoreductase, partial [Burkholderiales bacterium]